MPLSTKQFLRAELAEPNTKIATLDASISNRLRNQIVWMAASMAAGAAKIFG